MKINAAILALVGTVNAGAIVLRDATTITNLLSSISASMTKADNEVLAYHGGPPKGLVEAARELYDVIENGIETSRASCNLTHDDVVALTGISQEVSTAGAKLLNDLAAAAPVWSENGLCGHAYNYTVHLGKLPS
jgi:hypothetical protein